MSWPRERQRQTILSACFHRGKLHTLKDAIRNGSITLGALREQMPNTPLFYACQIGRIETVRWLCQQGCADQVSLRVDGYPSPMHIACFCGHLGVARFLWKSGARDDLGRYDEDTGMLPLHAAVLANRRDVALWIRDVCLPSRKNECFNMLTRKGTSPLDICSAMGHLNLANVLKNYGAKHGSRLPTLHGIGNYSKRAMDEREKASKFCAVSLWRGP